MYINIALIFLFWTVPTLIYYLYPFGSDPGNLLLSVLFFTNILLYAPIIFFSNKISSVERNKIYVSQNYIQIIGLIVLMINLYILYKVGFIFGIVDDSIRLQVYESAGVFWSILVALYSVYYLVIGFSNATENSHWINKLLSIVNAIIFISYGMKAGVVQIIISYAIGWFSVQDRSRYIYILYQVVKLLLFIIIGFWVVNSLRAKEIMSPADFFDMIYYYIAPNFKNFENITEIYYEYNIFMGGIFGGIYKIILPGYYDPLVFADLDRLEYQTWNVWSYLTTFYISGGLFEVYFGTFVIGVYTTLSLMYFSRKKTLFTGVNLSQNLLLLIFLHNQYYLSSAAPFAAIAFSYIIEVFCAKET